MLDAQDLQAISQMIATTAEAVKPIYAAMAEKQTAAMQAAQKEERLAQIKRGETQPETDEEYHAHFAEIRKRLVRNGRTAPANAEERKIWRDAHGYDYTDVSQLRR